MTKQEVHQCVMDTVRELRDMGVDVEISHAPTPVQNPSLTPEVHKAMMESLKHLEKNSKEYWTIKNALTGIHCP